VGLFFGGVGFFWKMLSEGGYDHSSLGCTVLCVTRPVSCAGESNVALAQTTSTLQMADPQKQGQHPLLERFVCIKWL
jgi:hypothetical protein